MVETIKLYHPLDKSRIKVLKISSIIRNFYNHLTTACTKQEMLGFLHSRSINNQTSAYYYYFYFYKLTSFVHTWKYLAKYNHKQIWLVATLTAC